MRRVYAQVPTALRPKGRSVALPGLHPSRRSSARRKPCRHIRASANGRSPSASRSAQLLATRSSTTPATQERRRRPPRSALSTPGQLYAGGAGSLDDAMKLQHSFWYQAADQAHRTVLERDPTCVMALLGPRADDADQPFHATGPRQVCAKAARCWRRRSASAQNRARGRPDRRPRRRSSPATTQPDTAPGSASTRRPWASCTGASGRPEIGVLLRAVARHGGAADRQDLREPTARGGDPGAQLPASRAPGGGALPDPHLRLPAAGQPRRAGRGALRGDRPDAPHALHMPSHIFTRVGRWDDSIETNRRSAEIARSARRPSTRCTRSTTWSTPTSRPAGRRRRGAWSRNSAVRRTGPLRRP